jgi:hypothetical protein
LTSIRSPKRKLTEDRLAVELQRDDERVAAHERHLADGENSARHLERLSAGAASRKLRHFLSPGITNVWIGDELLELVRRSIDLTRIPERPAADRTRITRLEHFERADGAVVVELGEGDTRCQKANLHAVWLDSKRVVDGERGVVEVDLVVTRLSAVEPLLRERRPLRSDHGRRASRPREEQGGNGTEKAAREHTRGR